MKRLLLQFIAFLAQNPLIGNFFTGRIYDGSLKHLCTPGLNCYSCPAAVTSCPVGSMQMFLAGVRHNISLYVTGFLLITGVVFGKYICGYVCPMGLVQDLLYKIRSPKIRTKLKYLSYCKYVILVLFVFVLPLVIRHELSGLGSSWFCQYICPSGTIFAAVPLLAVHENLRNELGWFFVIKASIATAVIFTSIFVYRPFCRILCPLGAFYGFFNRIAVFRLHCDSNKCCSSSGCKACENACDSVINPAQTPNSPECIRCGDCIKACKSSALKRSPEIRIKKSKFEI
ncbi:MAG: 4Fe-4S binding protein [Oscillospiraceae bacterium]|nr:4Fe-4S binding protein [Oscillospiraceae bacterium]